MSVEQLMVKYQAENDARSSNILSSIVQYYKSKGEVVDDVPVFDDRILDVSALFLKTAEKGGCPEDGGSQAFWSSMCTTLDISENHLTALQSFYMNYLFLYERQLRLFKKKQQAQRLLASQQASLQADQSNSSSTAPSTASAPNPQLQTNQTQAARVPPYDTASQHQQPQQHQHPVPPGPTGIVTLPVNRPQQQTQQQHQPQLQPQQQQQQPQQQHQQQPQQPHQQQQQQPHQQQHQPHQQQHQSQQQQQQQQQVFNQHVQQQQLNPALQVPVILQQKHQQQIAQHQMQQQGQPQPQHPHQHQQMQQVPYVKPMSQYMLKKQQRAKEAAAAAALLPASNVQRAAQQGGPLNAPPIPVTERVVPTPSASAPSGVKYRPPAVTQHQPPVQRPQPPQQQHIPLSVPVQHVPYVQPIPVGPVFVRENLPESAWPKKINEAIADLNSNDPTVVIKGLNTLLMKSFESDIGITLQVENYPQLLTALGSLLDSLNPIAGILFMDDPDLNTSRERERERESDNGLKRKYGADDAMDLMNKQSADKWTTVLPSEKNQLFKILARTLDENILLLNLLTIIKNLSYEASNETQIGASSVFLRHFVALLLASFGSGSPIYEVSQIAFEIFQNISTRLDLTGSKRMSQSLWLEDCLVDPKSFPQLKPRSSASASSKLDNLPVSGLLLSYIFASLQQCLDREQIKRGLDLLSKLAMSADNVELFSCAPERLLATLVELLCVNTSFAEPLYLNDPKQTLPGAKGGKLPACASSFFSDISDTEIRDLSLEAIWSLCTYSQAMQVRFAAVPNCVRLLLRVVDTRLSTGGYEKGANGNRSDSGMQRAAQILALMAQRKKENLGKFKTIQIQMCVSACSEELVQDVLCISVAPMFQAAPAPAPAPHFVIDGAPALGADSSSGAAL